MRARLLMAGIATAAVVGLATGNAVGDLLNSDDPSSQESTTYASKYVEQAQLAADHLASGDRIPVRETDDGEKLYILKTDQVRAGAATRAAASGDAYNPKDLLAAVRDGDGKIVGYTAANVAGLISVEAVQSPKFDLCALQAEQYGRNRAAAPEGVQLPPFRPIC